MRALAFSIATVLVAWSAWSAPPSRKAARPGSPTSSAGAHEMPLGCVACHREDGWQRVTFDHDATRMPLREGHAGLDCRVCHRQVKTLALDVACASCHVDVHRGRLGTACQQCHDQRTFRSGPGVEAHGQTRFPLYARHALVPCDKCHQARGDRTFQGVSVRCESCHQPDLERTRSLDVDHAPLGPAPDCRACHTPVEWRHGRVVGHEACFAIESGPHAGEACRDCHTRIPGVQMSGCDSRTARCTNCHACDSGNNMNREHAGKAGYACEDRKCYECHRGGGR